MTKDVPLILRLSGYKVAGCNKRIPVKVLPFLEQSYSYEAVQDQFCCARIRGDPAGKSLRRSARRREVIENAKIVCGKDDTGRSE
jgi:hypothetical protein